MAVVGIDLGTTNTVVAAVRDGRATALKDSVGRTLLPSVVSFPATGEPLVGYEAKEQRSYEPDATIFSIKRLIGRSWESEHVQKARPRFPFDLKEGPGKATLVSARGADYTLPEISALVLERARAIAEERLGETVSDVVITVPANFNDLQRAATKVAARVAGLEVLRILNEPTAAALAYGFGKKGRERIAVYDFGGGTFDITLLDLSENVFEVLATSGDTFLGGDDVDVAIIDLMAEELKKKHGIDAQSNLRIREQFRSAAEKLKIDLSTRSMAKARVEDVGHGTLGKRIDFEYAMKRADFEKLAEPLVERTLAVCQEAMDIAGLGVKDLDQVLLVGGSTRIPLVRRRISSFFGKMPQSRVNPDEVVAIGAAIQATALESKGAGVSIPAPPDVSRRSQFPSSPVVQTGALGLDLGHVPPGPIGSGTKTGLAGLKKTIPGTGGDVGSSPPPARASVAPSSNKRTEHSILSALPKSPTARPPEPAAAVRPQQDTLTGIGDEDDDNPRGPKTLMGVGEAEPPSDPGARPPLGGMESSRPAALPLGTAQGIGAIPTRPITGPSPSPALGNMNRTLVGVAAPANLPPVATTSPSPGVPVNPRAPLTPGGPAGKPFKTLTGVGGSEPVGAAPAGAVPAGKPFKTLAGVGPLEPGDIAPPGAAAATPTTSSGSTVPTAPMPISPMAAAHPPKAEPMQTLSGVGASTFPPAVSDSKVTSGSTLSRLPSVSDSRTTTSSQLSKLGPSPSPADASVRTTFANLGKNDTVTPPAPEARSSPDLKSSPEIKSSPDAGAGDLSFDDVTSVYPATRSLPPEAIPPKPAAPSPTEAERAARLAAQQSPTPALGQAAQPSPAAVPVPAAVVPPVPSPIAPAAAAAAASNFAKTMAFSSPAALFPKDDPPPPAADGSVAFDLSDLEATEGHDEDLPLPVRPDDAGLPARVAPKQEEITDLPTPSVRSVPPPATTPAAAIAKKKSDDFLDLPSRIDEADLPTVGGIDLPLVGGGAQLPVVSAAAHLPASLGGTAVRGGMNLPSAATQLPSARAQQAPKKSDDDLSISAINLDDLEAMEALDLSGSMPRSMDGGRGGALGQTQKVASSSSVTEESISGFLEDAEDDDELDLGPPRKAPPPFGATQLGVAPPAFSQQSPAAARPAAPQPAPARPMPLGGTQIGVAPQGRGGFSPAAAAPAFGATAPGRPAPSAAVPSAATLPAQGLPTPGTPTINSPLGRTAMSSPLTSGLAATALGAASSYDPSLDATAPGAAMYGGGGPLGETLPSGSAARTEHSVSTGLPRPPLLIDVTPLSLGVEVVGGYVDQLIERNSPIPCERTRTFATARDDQSVVRVRVSQGEANRFDSNTLLGEVELSHLQPGVRGSTRIDVTFSLDESGMLQVSARDQATGTQANATLRLIGISAESRRH